MVKTENYKYVMLYHILKFMLKQLTKNFGKYFDPVCCWYKLLLVEIIRYFWVTEKMN